MHSKVGEWVSFNQKWGWNQEKWGSISTVMMELERDNHGQAQQKLRHRYLCQVYWVPCALRKTQTWQWKIYHVQTICPNFTGKFSGICTKGCSSKVEWQDITDQNPQLQKPTWILQIVYWYFGLSVKTNVEPKKVMLNRKILFPIGESSWCSRLVVMANPRYLAIKNRLGG